MCIAACEYSGVFGERAAKPQAAVVLHEFYNFQLKEASHA
jgi:hypothetical protein